MGYEEEPIQREKHLNILVIYDIVENKRRYRIVKSLESYGLRVQKSAFELNIDKKTYKRMISECVAIINEREDSLRVYILSSHSCIFSWGVGEVHEEDLIVF